jgi:[ribosomal protein S5]-alanine N-acetyltransferase
MMLQTQRLTLRPIEVKDAAFVHQQMNDPAVTADLLPIEQPYSLSTAMRWIRNLNAGEYGEGIMFTILREAECVGTMYLHNEPKYQHAEIGYWFAKAHWGQGYATEAGHEVVRYGFEKLFLHRIYANYFARNTASRRVLEKLGLKYEGTQRADVFKDGEFLDIGFCGLLRSEWENG